MITFEARGKSFTVIASEQVQPGHWPSGFFMEQVADELARYGEAARPRAGLKLSILVTSDGLES